MVGGGVPEVKEVARGGWCAEGQLPKVRSTSATGRTMRGEVFGDAAGSPLAGGAGFAGVFEGGAEVGGRTSGRQGR